MTSSKAEPCPTTIIILVSISPLISDTSLPLEMKATFYFSVLFCVLLYLCIIPAYAMYSSSDDVIELTPKNFKLLVMNRPGNWLVEFYAPWCGHCRNLAPIWKKVATNLKGIAFVGAVNCDEHKELCGEFSVKGYPTLKSFIGVGQPNPYRNGEFIKHPIDYQSERTATALSSFITTRLPNHVIDVTESTFDEFSSNESLPKVLLFSSKKSKTDLAKALAFNYMGRIIFGQIHESEKVLLSKYNISAFPSVIIIKEKDPILFEGKLSAKSLNEFVEKHAGPIPKEWGTSIPQSTKSSDSDNKKAESSNKAKVVSPVIELTAANFESLVLKDTRHVWMVEFFAPWCGHCKQLKPEWDKAATSVRGLVKMGIVNGDDHPSLLQQYKVESFPTIKVFADDKKSPIDYNGGRSAKDISEAALEYITGKHVVQLLPNIVEAFLVQNPTLPKLVLLTDKKKTSALYRSLALEYNGLLVFGEARVSSIQDPVAQKFSADKLPSLYVAPLPKEGQKPGEVGLSRFTYAMNGDTIRAWIDAATGIKVPTTLEPAPSISSSATSAGVLTHAVHQKILKEACYDKVGICILTFIDEMQEKEETEKISTVLNGLIGKYAGRPVHFVTVEGVKNRHLADALFLPSDLPVTVGINFRKKRSVSYVGVFSENSVSEWVESVLIGRARTSIIEKDLPDLK